MVVIIRRTRGEAVYSCIIRELENEEDVIGVPVCGANLMSPVYDRTNIIGEVHYRIVTRLYIENADGRK
jgi:hypothetical protein